MKKTIISAFVCILVVSCNSGDNSAPGIPHDMRYVCDAVTLASVCAAPNARALTWIAAGDDGDDGQALQYDLRWWVEPMTDAVYQNANQFISEPAPQSSGYKEVIVLPRILPGSSLSFGVTALDEVAQVSGMATIAPVKQDFIRAPLGDTGVAQPGFGTVVEPLGDLDFRNYVDIGVGAPAADSPNTVGTGGVFVYLNVNSAYLLTTQNDIQRATPSLNPSVVIYGQTAGGQFGASISSDADFNADNVPDLVVGEPGTGTVYVFLGGGVGQANFTSRDVNPAAPVVLSSAQADITIKSPVIGFGTSVALLWNINNQIGSELLIGSPAEGRAYLFYGGLFAGNAISPDIPVTVDLGAGGFADWTIIGPAGSDFGQLVTRVQSISSSGIENFAVSAPGLDLVYLFYGGVGTGKAIDFSLAGPQVRDLSAGEDFDLLIRGEAGSGFGSAVSARRSLNMTAYVSLAIGAPLSDTVFVFYGFTNGVILFPTTVNTVHDAILDGADQTIVGDPLTDFGAGLSTMGDLNGDRWFDLAIGAPHALDGVGTDTGAVYEFLSSASKPANRTTADAEYVTFGQVVAGQFGAHVAGIGMMIPVPAIQRVVYYDDFLVGAPGENAAYAEF